MTTDTTAGVVEGQQRTFATTQPPGTFPLDEKSFTGLSEEQNRVCRDEGWKNLLNEKDGWTIAGDYVAPHESPVDDADILPAAKLNEIGNKVYMGCWIRDLWDWDKEKWMGLQSVEFQEDWFVIHAPSFETGAEIVAFQFLDQAIRYAEKMKGHLFTERPAGVG